jgi:hypothetical protein
MQQAGGAELGDRASSSRPSERCTRQASCGAVLHPGDGRTPPRLFGRRRPGSALRGEICPRQASAADRPPPLDVWCFLTCSLRPFPKGARCPAVGNALRRRPPPFSLSAWTCDGGRRTFTDMQTSEPWPFQGTKISVTGHPSKKRPRFSVSGAYQDDLPNDPCFVPRRFGLNRRKGSLIL